MIVRLHQAFEIPYEVLLADVAPRRTVRRRRAVARSARAG
jgi:hypothetical protein